MSARSSANQRDPGAVIDRPYRAFVVSNGFSAVRSDYAATEIKFSTLVTPGPSQATHSAFCHDEREPGCACFYLVASATGVTCSFPYASPAP